MYTVFSSQFCNLKLRLVICFIINSENSGKSLKEMDCADVSKREIESFDNFFLKITDILFLHGHFMKFGYKVDHAGERW